MTLTISSKRSPAGPTHQWMLNLWKWTSEEKMVLTIYIMIFFSSFVKHSLQNHDFKNIHLFFFLC